MIGENNNQYVNVAACPLSRAVTGSLISCYSLKMTNTFNIFIIFTALHVCGEPWNEEDLPRTEIQTPQTHATLKCYIFKRMC